MGLSFNISEIDNLKRHVHYSKLRLYAVFIAKAKLYLTNRIQCGTNRGLVILKFKNKCRSESNGYLVPTWLGPRRCGRNGTSTNGALVPPGSCTNWVWYDEGHIVTGA